MTSRCRCSVPSRHGASSRPRWRTGGKKTPAIRHESSSCHRATTSLNSRRLVMNRGRWVVHRCVVVLIVDAVDFEASFVPNMHKLVGKKRQE